MLIVLFSYLNLTQTRGEKEPQLRVVETPWVQLQCHIEKTLSPSRCPGSLALIVILFLLPKCSRGFSCRGCIVHVRMGQTLHSILSFSLWALMELCNNIHLLQKEPTLMKGKGYTYLWVFQFLFCCCVMLTVGMSMGHFIY